jgi:hypothetical protein
MKRIPYPVMLVAVVFTGMMLSSSGCRKKEDTIAQIYVKDDTSSPVSGANVHLYGQGTDGSSSAVTLDMNATTDGSGMASFNFNDVYQLGQSGVVVANIEATFGAAEGEGIIKVVQEETSEETVFIQ